MVIYNLTERSVVCSCHRREDCKDNEKVNPREVDLVWALRDGDQKKTDKIMRRLPPNWSVDFMIVSRGNTVLDVKGAKPAHIAIIMCKEFNFSRMDPLAEAALATIIFPDEIVPLDKPETRNEFTKEIMTY